MVQKQLQEQADPEVPPSCSAYSNTGRAYYHNCRSFLSIPTILEWPGLTAEHLAVWYPLRICAGPRLSCISCIQKWAEDIDRSRSSPRNVVAHGSRLYFNALRRNGRPLWYLFSQ